MSTFWTTFYSYKGGVGRTMALANVAGEMVKNGKKVLLIDMDLEAPGLDSFEDFLCKKGAPGVVEYVYSYLNTGKADSIMNYIQNCTPQGITPLGKLWLMTSGKKDHAYNIKRSQIDWIQLYEALDGESFVNNWKSDIEANIKPDYVLIDSRTGLTDIGGVCTVHFPQLVVVLHSLNNQNIDGASSVIKAISKSQASGSIQVLTVASPVPPIPKESSGLLQERLNYAKETIGKDPDCKIHYDSRVPLKEKIFTWSESNGAMLEIEYKALAEKIIASNPKDIDHYLKNLKKAIGTDAGRVHFLIGSILKNFGNRAEALHEVAKAYRSLANWPLANKYLSDAVAADILFEPAFDDYANYLEQNDKYEKLIQLYRERINQSQVSKLPIVTLGTCMKLGLILISKGMYDDAIQIYQIASKQEMKSIENKLAIEFNIFEAKRRLNARIEMDEVDTLIEYYRNYQLAFSVSAKVNALQAIHILYAIKGDFEQARLLLVQVFELAKSLAPGEITFSFVNYKFVSIEQVLEENSYLLKFVDKGLVWNEFKVK